MTDSMKRENIPIILTAFGTTEKAFDTYGKMDKIITGRFPDNPIHWSYSSRMVKHAMKKKKKVDLKDPLETMTELSAQGHGWVVLQSLHLICGHEFDRLVSLKDHVKIRAAMGLPLLTSAQDYTRTARALSPIIPKDSDRATILVGHGTDHPAWAAYPALESIARRQYGNHIFLGVVEGYPGLDHTLDRIKSAGYKKVCLIPLMLVAGVHFHEDLTREKDSWQKTFERHGIEVSLVSQGVGHLDKITDIYCDHISNALDVIPI